MHFSPDNTNNKETKDNSVASGNKVNDLIKYYESIDGCIEYTNAAFDYPGYLDKKYKHNDIFDSIYKTSK